MFGIDQFVLSKPKEIKPIAIKFVESVKRNLEFEIKQTDVIENKNAKLIQPKAIKTVAKTFLNQVNKIDSSLKTTDKLIFSYSDSQGIIGNLSPSGEKIRVYLRKNKLKDYSEDIIEIYSKNTKIYQSGFSSQTKGWGNTKELAIANAIKNAVLKLTIIKSDINDRILFNYSLSTIQETGDGGFECKVKVTPGKI